MEKTTNKENDWGHMTKVNMMDQKGYLERNGNSKKVMKPGKVGKPSKACVEMISASGEVWIRVMIELCQHVLDSKRMLNEWQSNTVCHCQISRTKEDINCNANKFVYSLQ